MFDRSRMKRIWARALNVALLLLVSLQLNAQDASTGTGKLRNLVSGILGVMFLIGFPWGVILIWTGANKKKNGDPDAYNSIIAGGIMASAVIIMNVIYYLAFGKSLEVNIDF